MLKAKELPSNGNKPTRRFGFLSSLRISDGIAIAIFGGTLGLAYYLLTDHSQHVTATSPLYNDLNTSLSKNSELARPGDMSGISIMGHHGVAKDLGASRDGCHLFAVYGDAARDLGADPGNGQLVRDCMQKTTAAAEPPRWERGGKHDYSIHPRLF